MMDFIRPRVLPEELDRGYLGFALAMNGFDRFEDALGHLSGSHPAEHPGSRQMTDLLAEIAALPAEQFIARHTTAPLRDAIGPAQRRPDGRSDELDPVDKRWTLREAWYFCAECAQADVQFHGRSYWRRDLQLLGQLWCPKHQVPLLYLVSTARALPSPLAALKTAETVPMTLIGEAMNSPLVMRYLDICAGLLQHQDTLDNCIARGLLRERAKQRGYGPSRAALGRGVAELIFSQFPAPWLATIIPALAENQVATAIKHIENVLYADARLYSCSTYILAAAVLFDSSDDALNAMIQARMPLKHTRTPLKLKRKAPKSTPISDSKVATHYAACRGNLSKTAQTLGISTEFTEKLLGKLGLPSLGVRLNHARERALTAFLVDGKSLEDSSMESGLEKSEVECLLRTCSANMTETLFEMRRVESHRPKTHTRARRMTPKAIHEMLESAPESDCAAKPNLPASNPKESTLSQATQDFARTDD